MAKKKIILLTMFFSLLLGMAKYASADKDDYFLAKEAVRAGNKEFALMHFLSVLREDNRPKMRQEAAFAIGEYYFLDSNYVNSFDALKEFLQDYPQSQMRPFALVYLLKISQHWGKEELSKDIEQKIKNLKQVVLLFKKTKEEKFKSPLGISHKIIYYIDRLEFYLDDSLQAQIFY